MTDIKMLNEIKTAIEEDGAITAEIAKDANGFNELIVHGPFDGCPSVNGPTYKKIV